MATPTKRAESSVTFQRQAGPLTTVFTTPDFCAPARWSATDTPALSSSICMPPEFAKYYDYRYGFYSPGICPMGYTEGCAFPKSLATTSNGTPFVGGTLMAGETARICCPTGYTCDVGSDEEMAYSKCIATAGKTTFLGYNYQSNTYLTTVTDALAFAIQVRWQSSDLPSLETDPTVPGSKYNGPMPAATGDATGGLSAATEGSGAETGAVATGGESPGPGQEMTSEGKSGFLRDGVPSTALVSPMTPRTIGFGGSTTELDSGTVNEMDATTINELDPDSHPWMELETREHVAELPSTSFVAELPGDMPPADWTNTTRTSRSTESHLRQRSGSRRESLTRAKTKS
ncbi:hypothetical protein PG993_014493 [Apiospora rasikravindrae]|uniref:Uncharacterized protein n=1 Tax=Apiospora rasikravindrae TaxID=990691 RepID=A0ABR1RMU8_9PEZI